MTKRRGMALARSVLPPVLGLLFLLESDLQMAAHAQTSPPNIEAHDGAEFCTSPAAPKPGAANDNAAARERPSCLPGPVLEPGSKVWRKIGDLEVVITVPAEPSAVLTDIRVGTARRTGQSQTPQKPSIAFELMEGGAGAKGSLIARFCAQPAPSKLLADVVIEWTDAAGNKQAWPFQGEIAQWASPEKVVLASVTMDLTPSVRALTQVRVEMNRPASATAPADNGPPSAGVAVQTALVWMFIDEQPMHAALLSAAGFKSTTTEDIVLGATRILKGATLTFEPASPLRNGQVKLKAGFAQGGPSDPFEYDGVIASWPWVRIPNTQCGRPN